MPKISQLTLAAPTDADTVQILQDGTNKKTTAKEVSGLQAVGVGQSVTDLTGSRTINTTYTNSTGKPILVFTQVLASAASSNASVAFIVDGVTVCGDGQYITSAAGNNYLCTSYIVPDGSTYKLTVSGTVALSLWSEVR